MEENERTSGPGKMQIVWGIQRDSSIIARRMQKAGGIGVCKKT
jgi:hypothetical protein